jgi:hypothetical protein
MASIPEMAYEEARKLGLDLRVIPGMVPTAPFVFECLKAKDSMATAFHDAKRKYHKWVKGMPIPILVYYPERDEFRIMDGMMRICAAQAAGFDVFPALVASGETYDALEPILDQGYYGEDFIEMLMMASPSVRENQKIRDRNRLEGVK